MPKKTEKPSLIRKILIGDIENSPLRKVLGDKPIKAVYDAVTKNGGKK
jgi:hypothetical protein